MCKPPEPEVFEKMGRDEQINTLYGVVLKLAARARFTNTWGAWAFALLFLPSIGWVANDRAAQIKRIDSIEYRVEHRAVQDSMATQEVLRVVHEMREELKQLHPRR